MRWFYFILLLSLLIVISAGIVYIHKDRVIMLKLPPASLVRWYKPENKRQVWLHNMFKLRREIQAVRFYTSNRDAQHVEKWVARLSKHYLKIGEMVPEWKGKLDMAAISDLQESTKNRHFQDVVHALDDLSESCKSCHNDYRAITATMYRAPDFTSLEIGSSLSFDTHMEELGKHVNSIKIAYEDGMQERALSSLLKLKSGMEALGKTCSNCHKRDTKLYPDETIGTMLASLEESLRHGTTKQQGQALGALAVQACAHCHGTHRLSYDIRILITDRPSWPELLKH